jgi:hypothetical protein
MKLIPALGLAALLAAGSALAATGTTAAPAAAPAAPTAAKAAAPQSECSKEASAKNLKGQARKDFLKTCKADAKSK